MYKKEWIFPLAIIGVAIISGALCYSSLPAEIPAHWNLSGEVDNYLPRLTGVVVLPVVMLLIFMLFEVIFVLSPKTFGVGSSKEKTRIIAKTRIIQNLLMLIMLSFYMAQLAISLGVDINIEKVVIMGFCLLFIVMGNYLGKFPRNMFVGIRTPWTLADNRVWLKTHRLAAWLFVGLGIAFIPAAFLGAPLFVFIGCLLLVAVSLILYSFLVFRAL